VLAKLLRAILASAFLAAPISTLAQPATLRLAILDDASEKARLPTWRVFRDRLRELGYIEGKNLAIEWRYGRGSVERLPVLAKELTALQPHMIITTSTPGTRAVLKATSTIPILFTGVGNPVESGLVKSLARPGGNATGLSIIGMELGAKSVDLLREIVPGAKRFAFVTDADNSSSLLVYEQLRDHARTLGVTVELFDGKPAGLERSLQAIARGRFEGFMVGQPAVILDGRERLVQFAARQNLPAVYGRREYVDAGGLVSYGIELALMYRRTADFVDRIAKGAKPSEMPVERPNSVHMVLNLKTSRAMRISIPPAIRHRADELID
jgi:putative ABC transport system substrate-binding protein